MTIESNGHRPIIREVGRAELQQVNTEVSVADPATWALVESYLDDPYYALLQVLVPVGIEVLLDPQFSVSDAMLEDIRQAMPAVVRALQLQALTATALPDDGSAQE